jgi:hypothetical protein
LGPGDKASSVGLEANNPTSQDQAPRRLRVVLDTGDDLAGREVNGVDDHGSFGRDVSLLRRAPVLSVLGPEDEGLLTKMRPTQDHHQNKEASDPAPAVCEDQ